MGGTVDDGAWADAMAVEVEFGDGALEVVASKIVVAAEERLFERAAYWSSVAVLLTHLHDIKLFGPSDRAPV